MLRVGLEEWGEKTWAERRAWVYFTLLKNEKKSHQIEEDKRDRAIELDRRKSMPKVDVDRGRR